MVPSPALLSFKSFAAYGKLAFLVPTLTDAMGGAHLTIKGSWQVSNLFMREQCPWHPEAYSVLST